MPTNEEQFLQTYDKLPKDVQEAMIAYETAEIIYDTAEKESIPAYVSQLAEITGDVMMGLIPITQFRKAIQERLGLDEQKARRIAGVIRDNIFVKVTESLRDIHGLK